MMAVGSDLDLAGTLQRIVDAARELVDAHYCALGVLDASGGALAEFVVAGIDDETYRAIGEQPKGHGILGLLIADPRPLRLADLTEHRRASGSRRTTRRCARSSACRSWCGARCSGTSTSPTSSPPTSSANATRSSSWRSPARPEWRSTTPGSTPAMQEVAVLEDRDRIAMDLHDTVIQQLFAIGLSLQGTARMIRDHEPANRLQAAVDDLDLTIKQIRSTIFALGTSVTTPTTGTRDKVLAVVAEASRCARHRTAAPPGRADRHRPLGPAGRRAPRRAARAAHQRRPPRRGAARPRGRGGHGRGARPHRGGRRHLPTGRHADRWEGARQSDDAGAPPRRFVRAEPAGSRGLDRQLAGAPRALRLSCE